MQTNTRLAFQLIAAFLVILAVGLILPLFGTVAKKGPQTKNLYNAKNLAIACKLYALDHHGRFPVHLSELEPDYIAPGMVDELRYNSIGKDSDPKYIVDWLYFGSGFSEQNAPTVLIASPWTSVNGKKLNRVVIQGDTAGFVIKEDKYQEMLSETVKQMRALDDAQHPAKPAQTDAPPKDAVQK